MRVVSEDGDGRRATDRGAKPESSSEDGLLTTYFLHAARYRPLHDVPPSNNRHGRVEAAHRVPAPRRERVPPGLSRRGGDREVVSHRRACGKNLLALTVCTVRLSFSWRSWKVRRAWASDSMGPRYFFTPGREATWSSAVTCGLVVFGVGARETEEAARGDGRAGRQRGHLISRDSQVVRRQDRQDHGQEQGQGGSGRAAPRPPLNTICHTLSPLPRPTTDRTNEAWRRTRCRAQPRERLSARRRRTNHPPGRTRPPIT